MKKNPGMVFPARGKLSKILGINIQVYTQYTEIINFRSSKMKT